jgi:indole-3-glycerol phosphate synthase
LRKDFLFDQYHLLEARLYGADAVLLIVAILPPDLLATMISTSVALGLTPVVEIAREEEARIALYAGARVIGINNRDLRTFEVDLETTGRLRRLIPDDRVVLAFSGISSREDVRRIRSWGVDGILVGESLMRAADPGARAAELMAWGAE